MLPRPREVDFLRACLWTGDEARASWARWTDAVGDARAALVRDDLGIKPLLCLLHEAQRRNALDFAPGLSASVAAVSLADERRDAIYREVFAAAVEGLRAAAVDFQVLRGAALAATVYPQPALRHSHDIDLLLAEADLDRAVAALAPCRFTPEADPPRRPARRLVHASALPVELHCGLFRYAFYGVPTAEVAARRRRFDLAGTMAATLDPADHLVHVCGQVACGAPTSLHWVCDAWLLVQRGAPDWNRLLDVGERGNLVLPLAIVLSFLADDLAADIPRAVLAELATRLEKVDRVAREVALFGVRAGPRGRLRALLAASRGWRQHADLLRWLAMPSRAALRSGEPEYRGLTWPWHYVFRPLAYVRRRVGSIRRGKRRTGADGAAPAGLSHRWVDGGSSDVAEFLRRAVIQRYRAGDEKIAPAPASVWKNGGVAFLAAVERERLGPLLYTALRDDSSVPEAVRAELQRSYRANALRNMLLMRDLEECLRRFAAAGVAAIVLKGAGLVDAYYASVAARPMADVDVLVRRADVGAACALLGELGYSGERQETHPGALVEHENEMAFSRPGVVRTSIDLHWSLIDSPFYQERLAMDWFWKTARAGRIGGAEVRTLGCEALLLHLCAHLALHHGGSGLLWWNDIAELLRVEKESLAWDEVIERAQMFRLLLPLREVLSRLAEEWDAPVPREVLQRLAELSPSAREAELFARLQRGEAAGRRLWTDLRSMPSWGKALRFAATNLFPSAAYMRTRYAIRHPLLVPFYYPYRWWRGVRDALRTPAPPRPE